MKKTVAIIGVIIAIADMILLSMQLISPITFWVVIGLVALIAFYLMPKLK